MSYPIQTNDENFSSILRQSYHLIKTLAFSKSRFPRLSRSLLRQSFGLGNAMRLSQREKTAAHAAISASSAPPLHWRASSVI